MQTMWAISDNDILLKQIPTNEFAHFSKGETIQNILNQNKHYFANEQGIDNSFVLDNKKIELIYR